MLKVIPRRFAVEDFSKRGVSWQAAQHGSGQCVRTVSFYRLLRDLACG